MLEEVVPGAASGDGVAPGEDAERGDGVEGEGEEIEGDEEVGKGELAVAEIVLEVVAVGLEDVEGLVLNLPPGTAAGGEVGDRAGGDGQIGDEGIGIGASALVVEDLDGEPVDLEGIVAGAQRHLGEPAVDVGGRLAAMADDPAMLREVNAGEIFGEGLM